MMTGDVWFWVLAGLATLFVGSSKGGLPLIGIAGRAAHGAANLAGCRSRSATADLHHQRHVWLVDLSQII